MINRVERCCYETQDSHEEDKSLMQVTVALGQGDGRAAVCLARALCDTAVDPKKPCIWVLSAKKTFLVSRPLCRRRVRPHAPRSLSQVARVTTRQGVTQRPLSACCLRAGQRIKRKGGRTRGTLPEDDDEGPHVRLLVVPAKKTNRVPGRRGGGAQK